MKSPVTISISKENLLLKSDESQTQIKSKVFMVRTSGKLNEPPVQFEPEEEISSFGIIGFVTIYGKPILLHIVAADKVLTLNGKAIYLIKKVAAIAFSPVRLLLMSFNFQSDKLDQKDTQYIKQIKKFFQEAMYFSYGYDLTREYF